MRHISSERRSTAEARLGSKKFVQQAQSQFCAWIVLVIREHGKLARMPLANFFNRPSLLLGLFSKISIRNVTTR